jgi:acyl carrier protein
MRVERVIGKVFQVDPAELGDTSSRDAVRGWDSMGHLTLVLALEEQFGVTLAIDDAMEMTDVGRIKQVLRTYGVAC